MEVLFPDLLNKKKKTTKNSTFGHDLSFLK